MIIIRKCAMLFILCNIFVAGCLSVYADSPSSPEVFIKCDSLLGKTTKTVFATLGQPDETIEADRNTGSYQLGIRPLIWKYDDHDPRRHSFGRSVELIFLPNHTLCAVIYDGFVTNPSLMQNVNGFQDGGKAEVVQILKTYILSSFKVGYREDNAKVGLTPSDSPTKQSYTLFVIKAKTKSGNNFQTSLNTLATNPFVLSHVFDANAGVYKNTYSKNPEFTINFLGGEGIGRFAIWSPVLIGKNPAYFSEQSLDTEANYDQPYMHFIPVTAKIMPWLQ